LLDKSGLASSGVFYDYNLYYREDKGPIFRYWNSDTNTTDWKKLDSAKNSKLWDGKWDVHSRNEDPFFLDPDNNDFSLSPNSPACTMSSTGSYVGALPCENQEELPTPYCGDGSCNNEETCLSCSEDCDVCPPPSPFCGDNTCNNGETCSSCSTDCGECPVEKKEEPVPKKNSGGGGGGGSSNYPSSSTSKVVLDNDEEQEPEPQNNTIETNSSVFENPSETLNESILPEKDVILEQPTNVRKTGFITRDNILYFLLFMIILSIATYLLLKKGRNSTEEEIKELIRLERKRSYQK
jgi:hypothetical protein